MSLAETQHFCPWTGKVGKHALPIRASASMCFPNLLVAFCSLFTNSTDTHALISCKATSTGIPDPFFPSHQVNVHADTQQPEIPPPHFSVITPSAQEAADRDGMHIALLHQSKNYESFDNRHATPEKKLSEMCHTAFPVCHEYRPCVLLRETATVTAQICTHLCINANISHSLAAPLTTIQLDFLP